MSLLRHYNIYDTNPKKRGSHRVFSHSLMDKNDPENFLVVPKPHGNEKFIHFRKAKEIADYIEMIQYYQELEGESEE